MAKKTPAATKQWLLARARELDRKASVLRRRGRGRGRLIRARVLERRARRLRARAARIRPASPAKSPTAPTAPPKPATGVVRDDGSWVAIQANVKGSAAVVNELIRVHKPAIIGITEAWQLVRDDVTLADGYRLIHADPDQRLDGPLERAAWHDCAFAVAPGVVVHSKLSTRLSKRLTRWGGATHERRMLESEMSVDDVRGWVGVGHPNPRGRSRRTPQPIVESLQSAFLVIRGKHERAMRRLKDGEVGWVLAFYDINVADRDGVPWTPKQELEVLPDLWWHGVDVIAGAGFAILQRIFIDRGERSDNGRRLTADHPVLVWRLRPRTR